MPENGPVTVCVEGSQYVAYIHIRNILDSIVGHFNNVTDLLGILIVSAVLRDADDAFFHNDAVRTFQAGRNNAEVGHFLLRGFIRIRKSRVGDIDALAC